MDPKKRFLGSEERKNIRPLAHYQYSAQKTSTLCEAYLATISNLSSRDSGGIWVSKINLAAPHLGEHKGELIGHRRQIPLLLRDLCRVGETPSVPCCLSPTVSGEKEAGQKKFSPSSSCTNKWKQSKNSSGLMRRFS